MVSAEQLAALYPATPTEASLVKESATLLPGYRARGDPAPLLVVQDERTLLLPDRRGNNRLDSLRNVVADGRVALLCLVPGKNETLRINGHATLSSDPALCQRLAMDGKPPVTVLVIHIEVVYFQCARALLRSGLWQPERWPDTRTLPTAGSLLREATQGRFDGTSYDAALPQRQRDTLY
ncbi:MAG: hypothetical protein CFE45_20005 [Burkholderiales bacterium PBB5]|nr:MAG: hypothetical protein CFE45_20005 [Burkholderiales bacterium PBB5]